MQRFAIREWKCDCEADATTRSVFITGRRSGAIKRSRQIWHYRKRDSAYFWHWEDQNGNLIHP